MPGDGLSLVQITDCHLLGDGQARLSGVDTYASLDAVIERILAHEPRPDLMLATGDLSQDGTAESYRRLKTLLARVPMPIHGLAGNHDDPAVLETILTGARAGGCIAFTRVLCRDGWQIVFLSSRVAGEDDGALGDGELAALDEALAARPDHHALVCLHHQPVAVGGAWAEEVSLANPDALFAVLDRHPQVRGVLFGHIHQPFDGERGRLRLMGSPSTCFQFVRADDGLGIADDPPGYRRLTLAPDGAIESTVCWL